MFKSLGLRLGHLIIGLIFIQSSFAQELKLSTDSIHFGSVLKGDSMILQVWVKNISNQPTDFYADSIYFPDFRVIGSSNGKLWRTLNASDSMAVEVCFKPRQNVRYNGEMIISNAKNEESYAIDLRGEGRYPGNYYSSTFDLYEEDLKQELKSILNNGAVSLGYNIARDWIYMDIDNKQKNGQGASQNELETAYIGKKVSGYTSRQDAQSNWNVNTEHTWPQSKFNSAEPMQSDMFHLFVVDAGANSRRSNHPFSVVQNPSWNDGGSKYGNSFFEPRDEQKGKSARAMLYFATRYQDYGNFLGANVYDGSKQVSQEELMRQWAKTFPVTVADSLRNERIYTLQKNRNPYVDHPEFLDRITTIRSNSVAPTVRKLYSNGPYYSPGMGYHNIYDTVRWKVILISTSNVVLNLSLSEDTSQTFPPYVPLSFPKNLSVAPGESVEFEAVGIPDQLIPMTSGIRVSAFGMDDYTLLFDYYPAGVGLENQPTLDDVRVYPNPSTGKFFIEQEKEDECRIFITDVHGRQVKSTVVNDTLNELNLSDQVAGVYFVRVHRGASSQVFRLIKQ